PPGDFFVLFLDETRIMDRGLAELKLLKNVKNISLKDSKVTDVGLRDFATLTCSVWTLMAQKSPTQFLTNRRD
ncbi:MAG TPA: hypothetical protein VL475_14685, partial [Planctomycetaceae bacterium]|nr:hypothetical protein [Planctomycetaceae bacterium]